MRIQAIPVFNDIHILRKSMLEALSDQAFLANQLLYQGYGDGILSGCKLTTTMDTIILNQGVLFLKEQMFLIKEPIGIHYSPTNTTMVLKIKLSEQIQDGNFLYRELELMLTEQQERLELELELCRFKLQEGARLRHEYQDFEDRSTEFDTINTIHSPFSAKGGSTLSPEILQNFSMDMLSEKGLSEMDRCVCLQLLSQDRPVSRQMLVAYLEGRNGKIMEDTSNYAIYAGLVRILKEVREGRQRQSDKTDRKKWRMLVE